MKLRAAGADVNKKDADVSDALYVVVVVSVCLVMLHLRRQQHVRGKTRSENSICLLLSSFVVGWSFIVFL